MLGIFLITSGVFGVMFYTQKTLAIPTDIQTLFLECLEIEFPKEIVHLLTTNDYARTQTLVNEGPDININEITWPPSYDKNHMFRCMRYYWESSKYKPPPVCAICERACIHNIMKNVIINENNYKQLNMGLLKIEDDFILNTCIQQNACEDFDHKNELINKHFISKRAINYKQDSVSIETCDDCLKQLKKKKIPKYSLANKLYRGKLPAQFRDLTWMEEQVCAIYRTNATVTRIFCRDNPDQPRAFIGNTCAHEMNIASTMEVLPRTPADASGVLSVVFVGTSPFKLACLKTIFRVRKMKIWEFLNWLKNNNKLYCDITLDESVKDMYPDDGALPGIETRVFNSNSDIDAMETFS